MNIEEAQRLMRNLSPKDIPLFGAAVAGYISVLGQLKDPAAITRRRCTKSGPLQRSVSIGIRSRNCSVRYKAL
jgi:hypothetical protein